MTREEAIKRLEEYKDIMVESIPSDKMQEALNIAIEALKNQEAERERIIKELQSEALDNLIKKNRRDGFGEHELCAGMPEYHCREGFSDGIGIAIGIVKRGVSNGKTREID